jgi:hypothetical protein
MGPYTLWTIILIMEQLYINIKKTPQRVYSQNCKKN